MYQNRFTYQPVRRKVFISYFSKDRDEVNKFVNQWANIEKVFIPKVIGVKDNDDLINSTNSDYIMSQIRKKYLGDSTVTIVLIGSCTHSRRYIDWEIKSSLRRGSYIPNGLIGILLRSCGERAHLPPRFDENWNQKSQECYARYHYEPKNAHQLRQWINDAHEARTSRADFIQNSSDMMKYNAKCKVCGITH
jgi:hypothetical protein